MKHTLRQALSHLGKRPLFVLFLLTAALLLLCYPHHYEPDPVFPQGSTYVVTVQGQVTHYKKGQNTWTLTLSHCQISHQEQTYACEQLLVTLDENTTVPPLTLGNTLTAQGDLTSFQPARNPGNFDWRAYYLAQHISYQVYADEVAVTSDTVFPLRHWLFSLHLRLTDSLEELLPEDPKTSALLTALLLGDKTLLTPETRTQYEDGGILHILTVSGLHVTMLGTAILALGKRLAVPPWMASLLAVFGVTCYWQLCGNGLSAWRAVIMFGCLILAPLARRSYDPLSALSLAGIWILWTSPGMLFQASFQLSFAAILGIYLVCPYFLPKADSAESASPSAATPPSFSASFLPSFSPAFLASLRSTLTYSLGLQLTLLPITLYHFFRYPLYGIFLNLLVLPLTTPLFLCGAVAAILSLLPDMGQLLARVLVLLCQWILGFYDVLCDVALRLPHASSLLGRPAPIRIALYYLVLGAFCLWQRQKQRQKMVPLALLALLLILLCPLPHHSLTMVFLDVGQGDGIYLETPTGTTILVDCGSSNLRQVASDRLTPFLESRGVDHLDHVFLTHSDADHVNGLTAWLEEGGSIGTVYLPDLGGSLANTSSYQQLLSVLQAHHVPILPFSQGMTWQKGALTLNCLAPVPPTDPSHAIYTDTNTASLVLLLRYQGISVLLTGDCEEEGEDLLLSYLAQENITCHILKVGHHGSAYATREVLLTQLSPQIAIISCGINNRYGHPHPDLLSRLQSQQIDYHVTAQCGAITVTIRQGKATIKRHLT